MATREPEAHLSNPASALSHLVQYQHTLLTAAATVVVVVVVMVVVVVVVVVAVVVVARDGGADCDNCAHADRGICAV